MKIDLDCPNAHYGELMRINCDKTNSICLFQYYKNCKGWWALTEGAKACPLRKEQKDGKT